MRREIVIKGPISPGQLVITGRLAIPLPTYANLVARKKIDLQVKGPWPRHLPTPGNGKKTIGFSVLDLLRCASRYFFIESWWAGQGDGWILSMPIVEYMDSGTGIMRWKGGNSNVARWLSEMAGVAMACYLAEDMGACNIILGNSGSFGPDYRCDIFTKGRPHEVWFEAKGTTTFPIPTATSKRAQKQIQPFKADPNVDGLAFYTFVQNPRYNFPSKVIIEDPEFNQEKRTTRFQADIASLASALSWAGMADIGQPLADTVVAKEHAKEKGNSIPEDAISRYSYRPVEETVDHLRAFVSKTWRSLSLVKEHAESLFGFQTILTTLEGGMELSVSVRPDNLLRLCRMVSERKEGDILKEAKDFYLYPIDVPIKAVENGEISTCPDGTALHLSRA
ncbi:hypothetical protein ACFL6U_16290 [Planctomycetota bacterium]